VASHPTRSARAKAAPERIRYAFADSSFGPLLLARSEQGLAWLSFVTSEEKESAELKRRFPGAELERADALREPWVAETVAEAESLGREGVSAAAAFPLGLRGTPFQRSVWDALLAIPSGQTRSYSEVARSIGRPKAVRAVAQACGANPVAIIVPCHRVIGADGSLTGYASGLDRKRDLLAREGSPAGS